MKIRNVAAAAAALSLVASPALAQTNVDRVAAPVEGESEMGGSSIILAILAAAAVVAGIIIAVDDDEDAISA